MQREGVEQKLLKTRPESTPEMYDDMRRLQIFRKQNFTSFRLRWSWLSDGSKICTMNEELVDAKRMLYTD